MYANLARNNLFLLWEYRVGLLYNKLIYRRPTSTNKFGSIIVIFYKGPVSWPKSSWNITISQVCDMYHTTHLWIWNSTYGILLVRNLCWVYLVRTCPYLKRFFHQNLELNFMRCHPLIWEFCLITIPCKNPVKSGCIKVCLWYWRVTPVRLRAEGWWTLMVFTD